MFSSPPPPQAPKGVPLGDKRRLPFGSMVDRTGDEFWDLKGEMVWQDVQVLALTSLPFPLSKRVYGPDARKQCGVHCSSEIVTRSVVDSACLLTTYES